MDQMFHNFGSDCHSFGNFRFILVINVYLLLVLFFLIFSNHKYDMMCSACYLLISAMLLTD
jgi:Na+/melibiose symporter-like transporter